MSDLLREVDDAIRAENMRKLWDEHKSAIVTGIAALILGTAAMSGWKAWELNRNQKHTGEIIAAMQSDKPADALLKVGEGQKGDGAAIALLNAGALDLKAGDKKAAYDAYTKASETKSADAVLRDLGTLQKISLALDIDTKSKPEDLLKDLEGIVKNKKSPWSGEAQFLTGFIKGDRQKDYAGALKDLETLSARTDVAESLKSRASALQSVYSLKLQEKK